ncbi:hypothetical protein BY458DRAFT_500068 [Sporodiniella umbellata]|nr:hypothetical protein BY458DRAFT_500068 [Sporodiniella umbellata]
MPVFGAYPGVFHSKEHHLPVNSPKNPTSRSFKSLHASQVPTTVCLFSPNQESSSFHLLFSCPPKSLVWEDSICEFRWPAVEIEDSFQALKSLDFYNVKYRQRSSLPATMVIIAALSQVWACHWHVLFLESKFLIY